MRLTPVKEMAPETSTFSPPMTWCDPPTTRFGVRTRHGCRAASVR